jgi:hypothetical protein
MADQPPLLRGCRHLPRQVGHVYAAKRVSEHVKLIQRTNWMRGHRQVEFLKRRAPHGHESISGRCSRIATYLELTAGLHFSGELTDIPGPISGVSARQQGSGRFLFQVTDDGVTYRFTTPGRSLRDCAPQPYGSGSRVCLCYLDRIRNYFRGQQFSAIG